MPLCLAAPLPTRVGTSAELGILGEAAARQPISFIEWLRIHIVKKVRRQATIQKNKVKRSGPGAKKERKGVGVKFSWELLDIFVGSWCATFVPHKNESEFTTYVGDAGTPECAAFVEAALAHQYFADRVGEKFPKPVDGLILMVITESSQMYVRGENPCHRFAVGEHQRRRGCGTLGCEALHGDASSGLVPSASRSVATCGRACRKGGC